MRTEHCTFAVLNSADRCIADCYRQHNGKDCTGNIEKADPQEGREVNLSGRRY